MNTDNKIWGTRFLLLLKRQLKKPGIYLLAACFVFLLYLFQNVVFPSFESRSAGIVIDGSKSGASILSYLKKTEGPYAFVEISSREELTEEVGSGRLDCGFVIRDSLDQVVSLSKIEQVAEYYASPSTMRGAVLKEKVFSAILRQVAEQVLTDISGNGSLFAEKGQALTGDLLASYHDILESGNTLQVVFETVDVSGDAGAKEDGSTPAVRFYALISTLLFAAAILFGRSRFQDETRVIGSSLRGGERFLWRFLLVLAPMLPITLVLWLMWAYYLMKNGLFTAGILLSTLLALCVYAVFCSLWTCLYTKLFRKEEFYLVSVPCVLVLAITSCGAFIKATSFLPVLGVLKWLFPVSYMRPW
ncbi:MAG: hypothetical protein IJX90_04190 [Blautia sp.]|nr:hypothetical protein [Blautia sp.]